METKEGETPIEVLSQGNGVSNNVLASWIDQSGVEAASFVRSRLFRGKPRLYLFDISAVLLSDLSLTDDIKLHVYLQL